MQLDKIHATVVTGFLGSGKTTLLSNLINNATDKRIAVIVNEFGEMDIDAELLRGCPLACEGEEDAEDGIFELANGCICCTVEEEFVPVMKKLIEKRDSIDHIVIETSGLALPKPLVQAFNWPEIKQHCTVDSVIAVLDGPAIATGTWATDPQAVDAARLADESLDHDPTLEELLDDQLAAADLAIVSKADQLDEGTRTAVRDWLSARLPKQVKALFIENGEADPELLTGLDSATEDRIEAITTHHDAHHAAGEEHEHAHDHFDSTVVVFGAVDSERLVAGIQQLIAEQTIYRVKGFVAAGDKPMRQVVQAVGERVAHYFDRLWDADETRATRLVFIGHDLDRARIREVLGAAELETAASA
ncbi:cobalamin biosynthesis protein CobW [Salinisphaera sp. SPP-AMP-43]|uniref:cobalamin biosynthesis protein CobW n=1 Tax=Salinisphaera sp. SPP-AMP-43 TaxID=3121288 RepID=UPI003C6DBE81